MTVAEQSPESGRYSDAVPRRAWYPACRSRDVNAKRPLSIEFLGTPLVVFRDGDGAAAVLVDRCPHRNAPLSMGRVKEGELECRYHGWRFDGSGRCVAIPGIDSPGERAAIAHATVERDGIVWFWSETGVPAEGEPFRLPDLGPNAREVVLTYDIAATMHSAIENTLDVPHTAFLHRGFLRGAAPNELTAQRRPIPGGVEVQYLGEPFGIGFLRRRGGAMLEHYDRFLMPGIAQVEYRAGPWLHIVNSVLHLPLDRFRTRAFFVLRATSQRLPTRLIQAVIRVQGPRVARQDVRVLEQQTATIRRFGGERYSSTDLDLFGNSVYRLLRHAEVADGSPAPTVERREVVFRA